MALNRIEEALASLTTSVEVLEHAAGTYFTPKTRRSTSKKNSYPDDVAGMLFSPEQLNEVKHQLDEAITQLDIALESADGSR